MRSGPVIAVSRRGRTVEIPLRLVLNASGIPVCACTASRCTAVYRYACREVLATVIIDREDVAVVSKLKAAVIDLVEQIVTEDVLLDVVSTQWAVADEQSAATAPGVREARLDQLTPRERQVFDSLVLGGSSKEIASELGISARTVEFYRSQVASKLQTTHITDLVRIAIAAGIDRNQHG